MWQHNRFAVSFSLLLLFSLQAQSLHTYRFLDDTSGSESSNIDIPIKSEDADYHYSSFNDPTMFYCEKTRDPMGVNDICALQASHLILTKTLGMANLSSLVFPSEDRVLFFKQNLVYVYGLQSDFDRPRAQLLAAMSISPQGSSAKIDRVHFDTSNQHVIVIQQTKAYFYRLNGLSMEIVNEIEDPFISSVDFINKKVFYLGEKYVVFFDKSNTELRMFSVSSDKSLSIKHRIEDCKDMFIDSKYVLAFTQDKIRALDGQEELLVDFPYTIKSVARGYPSGVFVYTENPNGNAEDEATIFHVEIFGKKGFRLTPALTCPRNAKTILVTEKNLYIVYENWMRIYPVVKENQFSNGFVFDFVFSDHIFGVLMSQGQEFLVVKGQEEGIQLYGNYRSQFGLECKKPKGLSVIEYSFQVRCFSTKCDNPDFSTQKFANGTCAYTRMVKVYPEEEGGTMGVVLLVALGFVAGIAITMGLGVFNCLGKRNEGDAKPHSPKDKKSLNINKGLRRGYSPTHGGGGTETKKFLNEGDESYPSEEFRDAVTSLNATKKKSQTMFETPRFTSFGTGHSNQALYMNINSHEHATVDTGELINSGGDEEEGGSDEKGKIKIEKLKLGEKIDKGSPVKDPASFRKDLASFRDIAMGMQTLTEEKEKKEPEGNYAGKYEQLNDEGVDEEHSHNHAHHHHHHGEIKDEIKEEGEEEGALSI